MSQRFELRFEFTRRAVIDYLMRVEFSEDRPIVAVFKELTRSDMQNRKFHALCGDAAKQATFMGRKLKGVQWKVLFISGHSIATGEGAEMVPGLEGEFVNIRESSAGMSVKRMASLIEYVTAWCVNNGVRMADEKRYGGYAANDERRAA